MTGRIALVVALTLGPPLAAQGGCDLDIQGTLQPGQSLVLSLTGAPPLAPTGLVFGEITGSVTYAFPLVSFTLGVVPPFSVLPLGVTDANGDIDWSLTVPPSLPPAPPILLHAQTVSLGFTLTPPGPPSFTACVSDVVSVQL